MQFFITQDRPNVAGLVLAGSADFKTELSQSDMFDQRLQAVILSVVDVSYGALTWSDESCLQHGCRSAQQVMMLGGRTPKGARPHSLFGTQAPLNSGLATGRVKFRACTIEGLGI